MQALSGRRAEVKRIEQSVVGTLRLEFIISSRALFGFRSEFLTLTRGTGIIYQNFYEYQKFKGELPRRACGVLVSMGGGRAVSYALSWLQERGDMFIRPGDPLYEGLIVGTSSKGLDQVVNASREKKLTNMRSSTADIAIQLTPAREMTLEFALEFIEDDELVEVTPKAIRLRKKIQSALERKRSSRRLREQE